MHHHFQIPAQASANVPNLPSNSFCSKNHVWNKSLCYCSYWSSVSLKTEMTLCCALWVIIRTAKNIPSKRDRFDLHLLNQLRSEPWVWSICTRLKVRRKTHSWIQRFSTFRAESQLQAIWANPSIPSLCLENISRSNAKIWRSTNRKTREIVESLADTAYWVKTMLEVHSIHYLNTVQTSRFV